MSDKQKVLEKEKFKRKIKAYLTYLKNELTNEKGEWKVRGFIDISQNIYSLTNDTKIISKLFEINLFPYLSEFAEKSNYTLEFAKHQNYYPDMTFIDKSNLNIKFAVDLKTTFRKNEYLCNGFTLGSHGEYFVNRLSTKNIQYPYASYLGHFCLGIIYDRNEIDIDETKIYDLSKLGCIPVVASNFIFFVSEKWKIASDKSGSGNTANIGSIKNINDILDEKGVFANYSEELFDLYWMNYGKLKIINKEGKSKKVSSLDDFMSLKFPKQ